MFSPGLPPLASSLRPRRSHPQTAFSCHEHLPPAAPTSAFPELEPPEPPRTTDYPLSLGPRAPAFLTSGRPRSFSTVLAPGSHVDHAAGPTPRPPSTRSTTRTPPPPRPCRSSDRRLRDPAADRAEVSVDNLAALFIPPLRFLDSRRSHAETGLVLRGSRWPPASFASPSGRPRPALTSMAAPGATPRPPATFVDRRRSRPETAQSFPRPPAPRIT